MGDSFSRIGINQLNHKLKVKKGGIEVTSGNVSGSAASTGSFGKLVGDGSSISNITVKPWSATGSFYGATSDIQITGSLSVSGNITGSFSGLGVGQKYLHAQSSAATTWTISHNFDYQYVNVDVYDGNDQIVIPTSITATNSNTITLTFNSAVSGNAIISTGGQAITERGKNVVFNQSSATTNWKVTHSIGEQYPAVTVYDDTDSVIIPQQIKASDGSKMEIIFAQPVSGNANISVGGGVPSGAITSSAQIASNISGSFTDASSSFSTRVARLETSGSITESSASFSTRVTTNEGDLTTLKGSGTAQGVGQSNSPTFVNVTATGNITAQEFHTEFVSSSIVYRSGSTKFGDTIDDIHSFTGSIHQSGSFNLNDGNMTIADTLTATTLTGTTIKDFSTISGSATSTGSFGRTSTATLDLDSIQGNWTNAGNTVADLGSITTVDINGGTINGITDLAVADGGTGASSLNNLITLTTHTTGNYVATITGGTNLTSTAATSGEGTTHTLNVDDAFLINNGNDTTSGTITAAGLITSGNVSGSIISTGSFGRLEAIIGPFFELDGDGDIMPL